MENEEDLRVVGWGRPVVGGEGRGGGGEREGNGGEEGCSKGIVRRETKRQEGGGDG